MEAREERKYGIVFVHGIVGNNKIFGPLQPLVPDGWQVRSISLQGHGGNALDFSRASMAGWKEQVEECVGELAECCDHVVAVGHSMGCLLLIDQAVKSRLSRLFMMNPPLCIRPRLSLLANIVKVATGHTESDVAAAARDAYGVSLDCNPLHYYGWPARYIELFSESRRARKHTLSRITCPVTAILSAKDEMVAPSSARYFDSLSNAKVAILPDSTHYYFPQADLDSLAAEFKSFIAQC